MISERFQVEADVKSFIHGGHDISEHGLEAWIVGAVRDVQNTRHVPGGRVLHLTDKIYFLD